MPSDLSYISDKSEYPICSVILLTSRRYRKSEEFWQNSSDNYFDAISCYLRLYRNGSSIASGCG